MARRHQNHFSRMTTNTEVGESQLTYLVKNVIQELAFYTPVLSSSTIFIFSSKIFKDWLSEFKST